MLYPMFALVVVTYIVLFVNFIWRLKAVRHKQLSIKYLRTFDEGDAPHHIRAGTRHYANLFELPILFYVACTLALALHLSSPFLVGLAWGFVVCRCVHAFIHMTYNHVAHRALSFWLGSMVVLAMWLILLFNYHQGVGLSG